MLVSQMLIFFHDSISLPFLFPHQKDLKERSSSAAAAAAADDDDDDDDADDDDDDDVILMSEQLNSRKCPVFPPIHQAV